MLFVLSQLNLVSSMVLLSKISAFCYDHWIWCMQRIHSTHGSRVTCWLCSGRIYFWTIECIPPSAVQVFTGRLLRSVFRLVLFRNLRSSILLVVYLGFLYFCLRSLMWNLPRKAPHHILSSSYNFYYGFSSGMERVYSITFGGILCFLFGAWSWFGYGCIFTTHKRLGRLLNLWAMTWWIRLWPTLSVARGATCHTVAIWSWFV